jgi:hypothetical protein
VRIRTTTSQSASPHPISITPTPDTSVRPDHGRAPSSRALVYSDLQAARGRNADLAPVATTIPLAALCHATADSEVNA